MTARIIILGSGSPHPDRDAGGTSLVLTVSERHYLFDCGHGATQRLVEAGIGPATINNVFLTHLHYDHVVDFPLFVLSSWLADRSEQLNVCGPSGTQHMVDHLFVGGAFDQDIRARGQFARRQENFFAVEPTVVEYEAGEIFQDDLIKVTAVPVHHVDAEIMPCFGMRIDTPGRSIVISGDTSPCEAIVELSQGVDLLIHESAMDEETMAHRQKTKVGIVAHTPAGEVGKIAARAGVKNLVVIHQGGKETTNPLLLQMTQNHIPGALVGPGYFDRTISRIREHYDGPVRVAQDLMRIDL